jgi:hypothetical protein
MHQRVRCPHCHHWTDALLVWAAGDCCPSCNAPLAQPSVAEEERSQERGWRPSGRFSSGRLPMQARDRIGEQS